METNNRNISNDSNGLPNVIPCPVCLEIKAIETMRDAEVPIGDKTYVLAICDSCYEKHIRSKQERSQDDDFPF
jgi:hypothetical protein